MELIIGVENGINYRSHVYTFSYQQYTRLIARLRDEITNRYPQAKIISGNIEFGFDMATNKSIIIREFKSEAGFVPQKFIWGENYLKLLQMILGVINASTAEKFDLLGSTNVYAEVVVFAQDNVVRHTFEIPYHILSQVFTFLGIKLIEANTCNDYLNKFWYFSPDSMSLDLAIPGSGYHGKSISVRASLQPPSQFNFHANYELAQKDCDQLVEFFFNEFHQLT